MNKVSEPNPPIDGQSASTIDAPAPIDLAPLAAGDLAALAAAFPQAAARDDTLADWPPGSDGAKARIEALAPQAYEKSRNHVDGKVSRLSPYIRHGVVELAAIRDAALDKVGKPK